MLGSVCVSNTWIFAHVGDATKHSLLAMPKDQHYDIPLLENITVMTKAHTHTNKHTHINTHTHTHTHTHQQGEQRVQFADTNLVLHNMAPLVNGLPCGHAFESTQDDNPVQHNVPLAALTVARYSMPGETIWDLCQTRPLLALPMASQSLLRNYVAISGIAQEDYNDMVDIMYNCDYLKTGCKMIYDGKWLQDLSAYNLLTVSLAHLYHTIALYSLHIHTNTHITTTTDPLHPVRGIPDRSHGGPRVVAALPDPAERAAPVPRR